MFKKFSVSIFFGVLAMAAISQTAYAARQPAMENAMRILQNAERALNRAIPNKGGHRVKALRHIRRAMDEVQKGMAYANRRGVEYQGQRSNDVRENRQERRQERREETRREQMRERRQEEEGSEIVRERRTMERRER